MRLQKLSHYKQVDDGKIYLSGAASPMMGAEEFIKNFDKLELTQLYRVRFEDYDMCTTWQHADINPVSPDILAAECNNKYILIYADFGYKMLPIVMNLDVGNPNVPIKTTQIYEQFDWIKKATIEDFEKVCSMVAEKFKETEQEYLNLTKNSDV
ncbi:MAG: hypothetical protein ACK5M3_05560 [Dysgonomonas sp.]